ncbi:MAG: hypothetical protein MUC56_12115 [Thermoanaerobaculales bacterium]|jgi:hypothetical protein|nr:hypothetical protein [Thermoanaerobaculales bacterium]
MKRLLLSAMLLALALPAAAQVGDPPDLTHPAMDAARFAIVNFLDLDPLQVEAWDLLWAEHRDAEAPIRQQLADIQAQIDALFATGAPDPTELGVLVIERHALGEALIDVHVVYVDGFQALLDEAQMDRLTEIRIADRIQPWIPAFKAFELVRR